MSTIVYRFGLLPPTENAEHVREQMRLANRYKNDLIAIERVRRDKSRAILRTAGDIEALEAARDEADEACREAARILKAARASTRSRSETAEMKAAHLAAKARLKKARAALGEARRIEREDPAIIEARKANWADTATLTKAARAANGLHWGTGAVVDEAVKAASKEPLYAFGEPCDPSFKRWTGEGSIGIQVHQKGEDGTGLTVASFLHGTGDARNWLYSSPRLREALAPAPHKNPKVEAARLRNATRRAKALDDGNGDTRERRYLHLRIGTVKGKDGKLAPLMATFPMTMHRPIPPGAIIKRAVVRCRKIGPREEWYACITVAVDGLLKERAPAGSGSVAVEIGWHTVPLAPHPKRPSAPRVGLQVARVLATDGTAEVLVFDPWGQRKADELQGTRKKNFNAARTALVDWLREHTMPEWMRMLTVKRGQPCPSEAQALAYLEQWLAPGRLAGLCRRWRDNLEEGEREAYDALEAWRYHDLHMWRYESDVRQAAERRRQDQYRVFAARLASTRERLIVSNAVYADIARRPDVDESHENKVAAKNRQHAAPGSLREILIKAFESRGGEVEKVPAAGLSTTCPHCGSCDPGNRDDATRQCRCLECGKDHDMDDAALLNMLRLGREDAAVVEIQDVRKRVGEALVAKEIENAAE